MRFYLAPLEGITGYVFRNAVLEQFGTGIDKCFTPFIEPHPHKKCMTARALNDILPEHNGIMMPVPQILTNSAEAYLFAERELAPYGYRELNLNLGCPSGTVTSKQRGSGLLSRPDMLDDMLKGIFENTECEISVKTRIGFESAEEWPALLDIYNKYPIKELIIHPRVRSEFYNGSVHLDAFKYALGSSDIPLCYNGDINSVRDYEELMDRLSSGKCTRMPQSIMTGRGMVRNPKLISQLSEFAKANIDGDKAAAGNEAARRCMPVDTAANTVTGIKALTEICAGADECAAKTAAVSAAAANASSDIKTELMTDKELAAFTAAVYKGYSELLSGDTPVLHKMNELWSWLILDIPEHDKLLKKIVKAKHRSDYEAAAAEAIRAAVK